MRGWRRACEANGVQKHAKCASRHRTKKQTGREQSSRASRAKRETCGDHFQQKRNANPTRDPQHVRVRAAQGWFIKRSI